MRHAFAVLPFLIISIATAAEPDRLVNVKVGKIPIILSVPHGGRLAIPDVPPRSGVGVEQFLTVRDDNTAELAELIAAELEKRLGGRPFLVIARFDRKYADANRAENAAIESDQAKPSYRAYHRALEEFTKDVQKLWKRGLLLDIHGQGAFPKALVRGTNDGQTVELLLKRYGQAALTGTKSLFGAVEGSGFEVVPATGSEEKEDRRYNGGFIVKTYGSHQGNGIDAIQLEFGSELRRRPALAKTASVLGEAIEVFCRAYLTEALKR